VKVADALLNVGRIFLDTAPLIYFVEGNPAFAPVVDDIFDRLDRGVLSAVTSPITLLECLVVPCRAGSADLQRDFTELIVRGRGVTYIPLDDAIARRGADLRARYNLPLADAFRVAAASSAGCDVFLTNDVMSRRVNELPILVVGELEV
jgi:predicted nucleic acid-binding protein